MKLSGSDNVSMLAPVSAGVRDDVNTPGKRTNCLLKTNFCSLFWDSDSELNVEHSNLVSLPTGIC